MVKGKLYIVATPIGNLKDLSFRALEVLRSSDYILAETKERIRKLLAHYKIKKPILVLRENTSPNQIAKILNLLKEGKTLALVSDAGSPSISDPGAKLLDLVLEKDLAQIIPIPGPSALTCALMISGFRAEKFCFQGYPPKKKKRKKFFENLISNPLTQVLFLSPHSLIKDLKELQNLGFPQDRRVFLAKEMTKIHEAFYRGTLLEIISLLENSEIKGEFTLVIDQYKPKN